MIDGIRFNEDGKLTYLGFTRLPGDKQGAEYEQVQKYYLSPDNNVLAYPALKKDETTGEREIWWVAEKL